MRGDDSSIHNISVHSSGRYALTSSNSVAQLWDLDTFSRKRTLNGAQTVGIQQVLIANQAGQLNFSVLILKLISTECKSSASASCLLESLMQ